MYLSDPPITTGFIQVTNHGDPQQLDGPSVIRFAVRDSRGLTLGLVHDMIMAALPSNIRRKMGTMNLFLGSLYTTVDSPT